jgi:hypothetical protein
MTTSPMDLLTEVDALTDDELEAAVEEARIPEGGFGHVRHVRLAWIYLCRMPLLDAIARMRTRLRGFAERLGQPGKYHETITWALVVMIHQRMRRAGPGESWAAFARANPDLLRWTDGPFFDLYGPEVMASAEAREIFVLPGLGGDDR